MGNPFLGTSVAISGDGNTAIVGGPGDSAPPNSLYGPGAAWIYARTSGVWAQQGTKLAGSGGTGNSAQGQAVAMSADGNTVLIGGPDDNSGMGAVWVFIRRSTDGMWVPQSNALVPSDSSGAPTFGYSLALSANGSTALIGGPGDGTLGAAWVFTRNSQGVWSQQGGKLVATGWVGPPVAQGVAVALSADGNTALIGGDQDNTNTGAAWIFTRSSTGAWSQQGNKLVGSNGSGARQGNAVALSGDGSTAMLGGFYDNSGTGAVWFFTRGSNGAWTQQGSKMVGTGALPPTPEQGTSVALSGDGNTAIEGGPTEANGTGTGGAWLFQRAGGVWTQEGSKIVGSGWVNSLFGSVVEGPSEGCAVAISSDASTAIIGGSTDNQGTGAAWIFAQPRFALTAPASAVGGVPINFTVKALDGSNALLASYGGVAHFTSSDTAATLPADSTLSSGIGNFSATFRTSGNQTITATDTANAAIKGVSSAIAVAATVGSPVAVSANPASGSVAAQTYTFTFSDPRGFQDLGVLNILVNNFLDGRHACYLAYAVASNTLFLVDDAGDAGGPFAGQIVLGNAGSVANSQCSVTPVLAAGTGNTLALTLNIAWNSSFAGDKVIYLAARDQSQNNSGWQPLGVWRVPGGTQTTTTAVVGMVPNRVTGFGPTLDSFTFSDTNGYLDLGVEDILVNSSLDGTHACYLAVSRTQNVVYLMNDAGTALLPAQNLGSSGSLSNSQCTVSWSNALGGNGNILSLGLTFTFNASFGGNRVFYLATRDVNEGNNTDWHAMGTQSVQ